MGLAIAMFSLCAGRARELSSRYVYGNGRNVAWETRNGISRTWSVGEDKLKTFRRQKHYGKVREHRPGAPGAAGHSRPTPVKRHDRFMLGICVANASSPDVHWDKKYDRAGRLSGLPLLQTHYGVKVEAWPQRSSPCFCAKESKERFAKVSSNTPRPHTPCRFKFTLRSLTQVTVLRLCFVYPSTKHTIFLKMSSVSHQAKVFLFCYLSCTRNLTKPHCFGEENEKIFPGAQPPDPLPSSDTITTQTPPPATPLLRFAITWPLWLSRVPTVEDWLKPSLS